MSKKRLHMCEAGDMWGICVSSSQFHCKTKAALKNKVLKISRLICEYEPIILIA